MPGEAALRKLITPLLAATIALWAQAGPALVQGDQVMQCSMTVQQMQTMGSMTCCPDNEARVPVLSDERPPCCSVSQVPERPLGFVVSSEPVTSDTPAAANSLPAESAAPAANQFAIWPSADAPCFVKAVLELKTDLRI